MFGGSELMDRTGELATCTGHERRTCCERANVPRARGRCRFGEGQKIQKDELNRF